jgi:hypothetical protein
MREESGGGGGVFGVAHSFEAGGFVVAVTWPVACVRSISVSGLPPENGRHAMLTPNKRRDDMQRYLQGGLHDVPTNLCSKSVFWLPRRATKYKTVARKYCILPLAYELRSTMATTRG